MAKRLASFGRETFCTVKSADMLPDRPEHVVVQPTVRDDEADLLSGNSDLDAFGANSIADKNGAIDSIQSDTDESSFDTDF